MQPARPSWRAGHHDRGNLLSQNGGHCRRWVALAWAPTSATRSANFRRRGTTRIRRITYPSNHHVGGAGDRRGSARPAPEPAQVDKGEVTFQGDLPRWGAPTHANGGAGGVPCTRRIGRAPVHRPPRCRTRGFPLAARQRGRSAPVRSSAMALQVLRDRTRRARSRRTGRPGGW